LPNLIRIVLLPGEHKFMTQMQKKYG